MDITITKEQAQTVIRLLDIATKAGGLEAAQLSLPIAIDIQRQLNEQGKNE